MTNEKRTKTGGRRKGTPNKTTALQRELLSNFLSSEFGNFTRIYNALEPEDKVKTYLSLLPYAVPKLQSVQLVSETSVSSIDEELKKLSDDFPR